MLAENRFTIGVAPKTPLCRRCIAPSQLYRLSLEGRQIRVADLGRPNNVRMIYAINFQ